MVAGVLSQTQVTVFREDPHRNSLFVLSWSKLRLAHFFLLPLASRCSKSAYFVIGASKSPPNMSFNFPTNAPMLSFHSPICCASARCPASARSPPCR